MATQTKLTNSTQTQSENIPISGVDAHFAETLNAPFPEFETPPANTFVVDASGVSVLSWWNGTSIPSVPLVILQSINRASYF